MQRGIQRKASNMPHEALVHTHCRPRWRRLHSRTSKLPSHYPRHGAFRAYTMLPTTYRTHAHLSILTCAPHCRLRHVLSKPYAHLGSMPLTATPAPYCRQLGRCSGASAFRSIQPTDELFEYVTCQPTHGVPQVGCVGVAARAGQSPRHSLGMTKVGRPPSVVVSVVM